MGQSGFCPNRQTASQWLYKAPTAPIMLMRMLLDCNHKYENEMCGKKRNAVPLLMVLIAFSGCWYSPWNSVAYLGRNAENSREICNRNRVTPCLVEWKCDNSPNGKNWGTSSATAEEIWYNLGHEATDEQRHEMARRNQAAPGGAVGSRQGVSKARRARPRRVRLPLVRRRDRAVDQQGSNPP